MKIILLMFNGVKTVWRYRHLLIWLVPGLLLVCLAAFHLSGMPLVIAMTIGGVLILVGWWKVALRNAIQLYEAEKLRKENRQLHEQELILKQQLEEARNRKLQVLNIQPILNFEVLEANCEVAKCFDIMIDKNGKIITEESNEKEIGYVRAFLEGFLGLRGNTRFIGTLVVNFTVTYGIRLQDLKIRRDDNSKTVYVEGAKPAYTGYTKFPKTNWQGCVVLSEKGGEWVVDEEAMRLEAPCKDMCRDYIEESLQNGPEQLEWLKHPLLNTVKHLLQMMIVPPEYSLVFVDKMEEESMPFFEYAASLGLDKPRLGGEVS